MRIGASGGREISGKVVGRGGVIGLIGAIGSTKIDTVGLLGSPIREAVP